MMYSVIPNKIQEIFNRSDSVDTVLSSLLPFLGNALECDRCFIYLRNPDTKMGKVPYCWCRTPQIPQILDAHWKLEPASLSDEDPMFAAALRAEPSIFIEDVEAASSDTLNRDFERKNFGHRALIHAHLRQNGQLWGVLQPCIFDRPRHWTTADRQLMLEVEQSVLPFAIAYVQQ
ncbi:MAG: GAF domain-containing protein [Leptolyngbyaceae cyanobacterium bins.302]|nr:GAF domain-containing protein [Leptolyngbyaceae cyanobacterium bins.302]